MLYIFVKYMQTGNRVNGNTEYIIDTFNMFYLRLIRFNHNEEALILKENNIKD